MAITYMEKGPRMHEALAAAGLGIAQSASAWISFGGADHTAINAFIAAYDPLPDVKADRVAAIKVDGLARINAIFPAITSVDEIAFYAEFWLSIKSTSRAPTANFQKVIDIYSAAKSAIENVNAAVDAAAVAAVVVAWPV